MNNSKSYVYFIAAGSAAMKIGVSDDPANRLAQLQTAHYQKLYLLFTIECNSRDAAFEVEKAFHRWYADQRLRDEWFDIAATSVEEDLKLLASLSAHVTEITRHVTDERVARLGMKTTGRQEEAASKVELILEQFEQRPELVNMSLRDLQSLGVGKRDSLSRAKEIWVERNGAGE